MPECPGPLTEPRQYRRTAGGAEGSRPLLPGGRRRQGRRSLVVILLAAAVVGAAALVTGPLAVRAARGDYLALGDSIAFGFQPAEGVPHPDYHSATHFVGYPEDVARTLDLNLVNASCPGETVASMISTGAPSSGCGNVDGRRGGYRTLFPLHVAYQGSQLGFAVRYLEVHPNVRLVTINLGLNDMAVCQRSTADGCAAAQEQAAVRAGIGTGMATIYRAIRTQAAYRGRLVAVTYYARGAGDRGAVATLDAVVTAVAEQFRVEIADGYGAFIRASASSGGDPCRAGLLIALPGGACDLHPTARGQAVLAAAVVRAAGRPAPPP